MYNAPFLLKLQCCYNCVMLYENTCGTKKLMQKVGFTFESAPADSWLLPFPPCGTSLMSTTHRTVYTKSYRLFVNNLSPIFEFKHPFDQYLWSWCFILFQH